MVFAASGLIPTRFLTLTAHLTIIIIILWSRDENIKACLPFEYSDDDFINKDIDISHIMMVQIKELDISGGDLDPSPPDYSTMDKVGKKQFQFYKGALTSNRGPWLKTGLGIAIGLLCFEYLGFLSGITMFMPSAAMVSIAAHASASVLLSYFVFDEWDCNLYWWVFAFCSVLPAIVEATVAIGVLGLKKS